MTTLNKQIRLAQRPSGLPSADTWKLESEKIRNLKEGEFLVKQEYISLDPAMRGWINDVRSYIAPVGIGEIMRAGSTGQIIESRHSIFRKGDYVSGSGGVQEYAITNGKSWYKVDPSVAPLPYFLGPLGMPGMTAYFGILRKGRIEAGNTVLVSAAAGAVGSIVGQIAKIKGCRVVGIAGGKMKCDYVREELGFDEVIDYKSDNLKDAMKTSCPDGIDVYFDNVGGEILDTALVFINRNARVVICGAISQYNNTGKVEGPSNYLSLLVNRASMEGMVVFDWKDEYMTAMIQLGRWIAENKIKVKLDINHGIENFHDNFLKLFSGNKMGKLILKLTK